MKVLRRVARTQRRPGARRVRSTLTSYFCASMSAITESPRDPPLSLGSGMKRRQGTQDSGIRRGRSCHITTLVYLLPYGINKNAQPAKRRRREGGSRREFICVPKKSTKKRAPRLYFWAKRRTGEYDERAHMMLWSKRNSPCPSPTRRSCVTQSEISLMLLSWSSRKSLSTKSMSWESPAASPAACTSRSFS